MITCHLEEPVDFSMAFLLLEVPGVAEMGKDEVLKFLAHGRPSSLGCRPLDYFL